MMAAAFLADFNARFACSVNLRGGREFDQSGRAQSRGSSCADCFGCESRSGDMGVADAGFSLHRKNGQLQLSWGCPGCGITVWEETSLMSATADAKAITADAQCHRCRSGKEVAR